MILDGRTLTPAQVAGVARGAATVRLDKAARARNSAACEALAALLEAGTPVYGVTTGVGALRSRELAPRERAGHQLRLLRSHACGAGRPLAPERVRATMVVRANQLGAGGAAVSDHLLESLVAALNAGFVPLTRELGSLGTGDLSVLADIALALLGEGRVWHADQLVAAGPALGAAGLVAPELGPRDGIAFMSSSAATIGHAALVSVDADLLLEASLAVAALSFMAAQADAVVLDPRVHAARAHPGQVAIAARMRELLGSDADAGQARSAIHDPYPFRALAQVEGAHFDAVRGLEDLLAVELNAAGENALIDPGSPEALPNANFHAGALAIGLDRLRAALAQSASLVAARVSSLLDPGLMGLPAALAERPGQDSGAMMLEYTAHAAAADVRLRAGPVAAQAVSVGGGIESHASLAPFAARYAEDALESAAVAIATELVIAVRALRMRGRAPSPGEAGDLFAAAAELLGADQSDRAMSDDIEAARKLVLRRGGA
ncbi:MAG TPA: aromatic amino acid ammonia-lyase [Thermoleophilaceae bacterium]|nr:aromatic amino acid ammonia-lyase [Thermoleophilaceae bacterium]